jgi:hypothetical protein
MSARIIAFPANRSPSRQEGFTTAVCPHCHSFDNGAIIEGREWRLCYEHKTRWRVAAETVLYQILDPCEFWIVEEFESVEPHFVACGAVLP